MKDYKLPKDAYSLGRYDGLHFAVSQFGTEMHKGLWNMLVGAGLTKRQIFTQYMKVLRTTIAVNRDILECVGVPTFCFRTGKKPV